jgi:hypothetical protein
MNRFSLLFICGAGIVATSMGILYGLVETLTAIEQSDIILVDDYIAETPSKKTTGGSKNSQTHIVIRLNKYQGRSFKTPIEYFETKKAQLTLSRLKPDSKVTIGFLKSDYELFKSETKSWGVIEGFRKSKKLHYTPIYSLTWKNNKLLTLDNINSQNRTFGFTNICGSGFFLIVFIIGFKEIWNIKKKAEHNSR